MRDLARARVASRDRGDGHRTTADGAAVRLADVMKYRRFEPLDRELSQLVLGTNVYRDQREDVSVELLDAWLELGGTGLDTAREYGLSERIVGRWLRERGVGDEMAIVTKGAHQDNVRRRVTPADIAADLHESLAALGRDSIDVYLLHRDDPAMPVARSSRASTSICRPA